MFGRAGALNDAEELFWELQREQRRPHSHDNRRIGVGTWTAMIGVYGEHKLAKKALSLFEKMTFAAAECSEERIKPNEVTLCAVLSACSRASLVHSALEIVRTMRSRYGVSPSGIHHNCITDALGRAGRLEEAETYLLVNLVDHHSKNDLVVAWMALLGACRIHGDTSREERAEQRSARPQ